MSTTPNQPTRADAAFAARAQEIADFRVAHGKFPAGRSTDNRERILGRWLSNIRTTHRGNTGKGPTLNPERIALLSELLPGWDQTIPGNLADDTLFEQRLRTVAAFVHDHGRMPRTTTTECENLGAWLTRVRSAANGRGNMAWTADRARLVEEILPGWLHGPRT